MRETVQQDVSHSRIFRSRLLEVFAPLIPPTVEPLVPPNGSWPLEPLAHDSRIELEEEPLTELLDGRQPVRSAGNRRHIHGYLNVLHIAVDARRRRLEAREAVQAADFPQPVDRDHAFDRREIDVRAWVGPCFPRQGFG